MTEPVLQINANGLVHDTIDGEAIVLNVESGTYYSLYGSAADIWNLLAVGGLQSDLCRVLADHYGSPQGLDDDVRSFVRSLQDEGLVVLADGKTHAPMPERLDSPSQVWEKPALKAYEDLQDLLTIDPIHDVDDRGWPNAKRG